MKTEEINKLKTYFSKQPVELVYLFGSMAKGLGKAYSDIDFAILFNKELSGQKRFDLKLKIIGDLCFILKTDSIDVVDLKDASPFLKFEAMKPRYEIFINNEVERVEFESRALSEYLDIQYYLRRHI